MVRSEYTSMSMIHALQSHLVPRPLAWGSYVGIPDVYFLLCEFLPMQNDLPDKVDVLARAVAEFHKASATITIVAHDQSLEQREMKKEERRRRKYGFDMTTYHGNVPIQHGWSDTWEEYFTRTTRRLLEVELEARGHWSTRDATPLTLASGGEQQQQDSTIVDAFFTRVVPRLLRPLEPNIQPVLIHGDLWHGNVGRVASASAAGEQLVVVFDAASFWAHNECKFPHLANLKFFMETCSSEYFLLLYFLPLFLMLTHVLLY